MWFDNDEDFRVASMHTAVLMSAKRDHVPFSLWIPGRLFGYEVKKIEEGPEKLPQCTVPCGILCGT